MYKHALIRAKNNYTLSKLKDAKGNGKKTWDILKNNCGLKASEKSMDSINIGNMIVKDPKIISNEFSNYYESAATNLANQIRVEFQDHKPYLPPRYEGWDFTDTTREEILLIIKSLKNKKVQAMMVYQIIY